MRSAVQLPANVAPKTARGYELDHLRRAQRREIIIAHMQHLAQHLDAPDLRRRLRGARRLTRSSSALGWLGSCALLGQEC